MINSINLGGWLVSERWISSNTGNVDFITKADFEWLANRGIRHIRLPIGYWVFEDQYKTVDKVMDWSVEYGLTVLLDLHGAPGSQNGQEHSGTKGPVNWHKDQNNIIATQDVLEKIALRWGQHPALFGIGLLNEPAPSIPIKVLEAFYINAYSRLRPLLPANKWLVVSDSFRPHRWLLKLSPKKFPGLAIENHHYQLGGWVNKRLPLSWQLLRARVVLPVSIRVMTARHPLIIGEWSAQLRSEKLRKLPKAKRQRLINDYYKAQLRAFGLAEASYYWTYKTDGGGPWSYKDLAQTVK